MPSDVRDAINWQAANGLTFDFLFNAQGVDDARSLSPTNNDPLTDDPVNGLLANKAAFHWVNHTLTHRQLDSPTAVTPGVANTEIQGSNAFATANALPGYSTQEIVTGEHSGIGTYLGVLPTGQPANPNVLNAFTNNGIQWVGDDNSAKPNQRAVGTALTVPRYPSNVYYNVAVPARPARRVQLHLPA